MKSTNRLFRRAIFVLLFFLFISPIALAQLSVSRLFNDGAIIQRDQPFSVWGWGEADATISVTFGDSTKTTTVETDGRWSVQIGAIPFSGPYTLTINSGESTISHSDIMMGDVYLISGQSNMEMTLNNADGGAFEAASANYPNIREFRINKATAPEISDRLASGSWRKALPAYAGTFSAVGFFFAKNIHLEKNVPIGLVNNSYGGARIEAFMSEQMLGFDENDVTLGNGETERQPTLIYNKMVHPILPFSYKGIVWYQAESNGDSMEDATSYAPLFKTMITSYRDSIGLGELPFLWVQLPNFGEPVTDTPSTWDAWPQLRAQQSMALDLPNTGEAITIDVGDVDIHPTNKKPVGERIALLAQQLIYGDDVISQSPRYQRNSLTDSGAVLISFDHIGSGLVAQDADDNMLKAFALAGSNGQFVFADAKLVGNEVLVWSDDVPEPESIRYAWEYNPGPVNLYNAEGLPAAPFQASVNPGFKIGSFKSAREAIEHGQTTTLSWEVFNASTVTLDGVPVDSVGSQSISPIETTSYEMIAYNKDDSTDTDTARVTVLVLDPSQINRLFGKNVTASTFETCCGDPLYPQLAIDEDLTTRWSSAWSDGIGDNPEEPQYDGTPDDEWIAVDLGEFIDINLVNLEWEAAYGDQYTIETSFDGYLWTSVFEEMNGNGDSDIITFQNPVPAKYVRMHGLNRATEYGYSLYEFAAYGTTSDIVPPTVSVISDQGNFIDPEISSVLFTADAADENGTIVSIEFLVDGESVETDTEAPYEFTLTLKGADSYEVSAIATDNDELKVQSKPYKLYQSSDNFTRFEAEDATFTGTGFITPANNVSAGEFLDLRDGWTLTFPTFNFWESGKHVINFRYQLTYQSPKSQYLVINQDTVDIIEFTAENTTDWLNLAYEYDFEQAENTLALHGFWEWMSFDYIEIEGVNEGLSTDEENDLPNELSLSQNYPNPFNPTTIISFSLPHHSDVKLQVYDMSGRLVSTLMNETKQAGNYQVNFDARNLSSGVYFYQLSGEFGTITRSMTLIK